VSPNPLTYFGALAQLGSLETFLTPGLLLFKLPAVLSWTRP
jgi:hypothetical protein